MLLRVKTFALCITLAGALAALDVTALPGVIPPLAVASAGAAGPVGAAPYPRARLSLTPPRAMPGSRVHVIARLRGLPPDAAVEVQVAAPAAATVTLVDIHTRATGAGAVDQPLAFAAPRPGAYVVFVNVGAYADSRSPLAGGSLQATLPVGASGPFLALPCGAPLGASVACQLSGYGFTPYERVSITYRVVARAIQTGGGATIYRRAAMADGQGSFVRPVLSLAVDPRAPAYTVTVVATGARGDSATISVRGAPSHPSGQALVLQH